MLELAEHGSSLFLKNCTPWKGTLLEQLENCSLWEGPTLEKLVQDCLPRRGESVRSSRDKCYELKAIHNPHLAHCSRGGGKSVGSEAESGKKGGYGEVF